MTADQWLKLQRKNFVIEDCNAVPLFSEDDGSVL